MLTIDVKLNGQTIAQAKVINASALADISDYEVLWSESPEPSLGIPGAGGSARIEGHRRRQSVWALVAKATVAILDQLSGGPNGPR